MAERRAFSAARLPGFGAVAGLVLAALYAPILVLTGYAFNAGRSAAATVILFLLLLVFTLFQVSYSERKVHYGS